MGQRNIPSFFRLHNVKGDVDSHGAKEAQSNPLVFCREAFCRCHMELRLVAVVAILSFSMHTKNPSSLGMGDGQNIEASSWDFHRNKT